MGHVGRGAERSGAERSGAVRCGAVQSGRWWRRRWRWWWRREDREHISDAQGAITSVAARARRAGTGDSPGVEAPATGQVSRHWRLGVGVRMPVYVVPRAPSVTAVLERVRAEREDSARLSTLARELLGHRDPPATAATPSASKHECRTHARTSCATAASSGSERQPADDEEACRERRLVGRLWPKWHGPNRIIPRGRRSTPVLREASKHSLQNWWISNANDGKLSPRRRWPSATTPPNRLGSLRPARGWRR